VPPVPHTNVTLALSRAPTDRLLHFTDKAALRFVNLYWPIFYKEMLPHAAEGWDKFWRGQLNRFFLKVPFSTVFPQN
jgi:hypothetical protein